jgi:hypothetical protein
VESNTSRQIAGKIRYAFRRPRFPIVYAADKELLSAASPAAFQRQIDRLDLLICQVQSSDQQWFWRMLAAVTGSSARSRANPTAILLRLA